ncbi:uncharacterized protein LOC112054160 isoform X3 [Bicyclus anynana]|uniref:Uncharacterized protein LOC112054160 isoform X3 n=1 Tax=Bicyclus anynana TaxID=110368 RepID=A0A6J1NY00_BICAN|nr:uncharacterized protein LOC112054160 isoform X3 [Bicyclus anynana]
MSELKICRICLRTEAKVYNYEQFQLKSFYEEVLALKVSETDELPHYFCFECATLLHKFHKFKEKCYVGQKVLKDMLSKGQAGILELSKFSSKLTPQESEVENPFLNSEINIPELPVLNNEFNNTDPVEIDSFFINNLDVVLEDETIIESTPLDKISDDSADQFQALRESNMETDADVSKNIKNQIVKNITIKDQLPIVISDLPSVNQTLLESDIELEGLDSNLAENLDVLDDNDSSSILYGDLPSISQVFDESNIEYIENNMDLSTDNDIDSIATELPDSSQAPVIEYVIESDVDVTKTNHLNVNVDSVDEPQDVSQNFASCLDTEKINTQLCPNEIDKLIINKSVPIYNCESEVFIETNSEKTDGSIQSNNLVQAGSSFINKNKIANKVRITSKNQLAPNIHSVLPTTSQEYFETAPEPVTESIDAKETLSLLQVEQSHVVGKRNRRKYPFKKGVKPSPCHKKCGNKCSTRLTEIDRMIIHKRYWEMDKTEQQDWLISCIRPKSIGRRQGSTFMRNITYEYYINHAGKDMKVCQQFLMKTLDVSQMKFRYAISKHGEMSLQDDLDTD